MLLNWIGCKDDGKCFVIKNVQLVIFIDNVGYEEKWVFGMYELDFIVVYYCRRMCIKFWRNWKL